MPVLFMRLRSGRIWYDAGFGEAGDGDFKKWKSLLSNVDTASCTPILGGGLHEPLYGSNRDLAVGLADQSKYPLSSYSRDALPQVTQYLSIDQDISTLLNDLNNEIRTKLQARYASDLTDALKAKNAPVLDLITFAGRKMREKNPVEQHKVLAELQLPVYITTNYDNLMYDALADAGVKPELVICPWSDRFDSPSVYDREPNFVPSPDRPLVYHLFGHFSVPDSLVLTEDDHFEFLIGVTKNNALIPSRVRRVLVDSATMFLGFQLDDWSFRIFFRYIMDMQGSRGREKYAHIAVQVDPDEIRNTDPKRAREYLEDYFRSGSINIYWGQSQDFLKALSAQRAAALKEG
jgi:hypothetical protein